MKTPPTMNSELCTQNSAVEFTAADLELLRQSAEFGRAMMFNMRQRGRSYQEKRYEFAKDWAEGNHWNTKRSRDWAAQIKKELEQMRTLAAARAAAGESGAKARPAR